MRVRSFLRNVHGFAPFFATKAILEKSKDKNNPVVRRHGW